MADNARVEGLREFRLALKALHPQWPKALNETQKDLADIAAKWSRDKASSMGGVWSRAKSAIGSKGTAQGAAVQLMPSGIDRMAPVAFWGAKKHTGWYANPRYNNSPPQHPPWIGDSWEAGVAGQGPYAINNAIAEHSDDILDEYGQMLDRLVFQAFPNGPPSPTIK